MVVDANCVSATLASFCGRILMTSFKQIAANRRNALQEYGPDYAGGKEHFRSNAVRYGLTIAE
jgi:hypothetical protein